MRWWTGIIFILIAALPYVAMLHSGATRLPQAASAAEELIIVSPHRREVRLEYSRGFQEWMQQHYQRNVSIQWLDVGGTSKILKDLESRFGVRPDHPGVDLLFGGGVAPYITAREQNWLAAITPPPAGLNDIPHTCAGAPVYDASNYWFGVALSGFGILYNKPIVERMHLPVPATWDDLARPEYFTWVSSGDPRSSGSVHMCYEIILQVYGFEKGWSLITRLCANVRNFGEGGGTGPREVAAGEVAAGMVIDQYAQTVIDAVGGGLLVFVLPRNATVVSPDAIGMVRGADHAELARLFIEYALSADGQRLLCQPAGQGGQRSSLYRLPVHPSVYRDAFAPKTNPYEVPAGFVYDDKKGSRRWNVVNDLIGNCLIEQHADLKRAWQAIIAAGCPPAQVEALCRPPVTGKELDELAGKWKDARFRLETMQKWSQEARRRYQQLAAGQTVEP